MSMTASLADYIDEQAETIIAVWRDAVAKDAALTAADRIAFDEFVDDIPGVLDRLAERLRGLPAVVSHEARLHGRARWKQGYDIVQLARELGCLRGVLHRATFGLARDGRIDSDELQAALAVVDSVIDETIAEAVGRFQEEGRRRSQLVLAQFEEREAAAEDAWIVAEVERAKLRVVLERLPVSVWVVDAEGRVVGLNREAERLQGFSASEAIGQLNLLQPNPRFRIFHPEDGEYDPSETQAARALRGEVVVQEEVGWQTADASLIATVNAAPLTNNAGVIVGAVVVVQDITARKQSEEAVRASEEKYQDLFDNAPDMMASVDARSGAIVECNRALADALGRPREQIVGRSLVEIHSPGCHRKATAAWRAILERGEAHDVELCLDRDDAEPVDVSLNASVVLNPAGTSATVRAVWRDITDRKRLESDLAGSESQFRTIAEQSPVLMWRTGVDGRCNYLNRTWYDFRGRSTSGPTSEGFDGRTDGVHPDDLARVEGAFQAAFAGREVFQSEFRLLRGDGQYRWVTDRGSPYYDGRDHFLGYLGSRVDITERIELEEALARQRELAEEGSRHKTHLLSALSHDARTPLNAVVLAAELLEVQVGQQDDPEVAMCLRTIRHSVKNVLDLLGDLLNLSRIDAGATPAQASVFPIELVLAESLSSVENQAKLKGLTVSVDLGDLAGANFETDRAKLKQIVGNLLSNAVRYTDKGSIALVASRAGDQVHIAVRDTGIGVAPSDQGRIFDEFATLDHPHRPMGEGTGLGLAICRRLANLLKGEITLESTPGEGSTFTLALPAGVISTALAEVVDERVVESNPAGAVVIVEDHLASRQTLAKVLKRMGYRAVEAGNGRDALEIVRRERPLAVLMDVNMPVMDGVDATLALRADPRFRDLPIFALTGDVSLVNQQRIGDAGVSGFLEKPVTWEKLQQALGGIKARASTAAD